MANNNKPSNAIQAYFPPTLSATPFPTKQRAADNTSSKASADSALIGDGFTPSELDAALHPPSSASSTWTPETEYAEMKIQDLIPGPRAVTFMGRVVGLMDVGNVQRGPRSAKGGLRMVVRDGGGGVTVRLWYATRMPNVRLGSLVSVWTNHISNGEYGNLSSATAPLFASLFPERDRSCHLMVHENSDDGTTFRHPLGYREGRPLSRVMTLQNFADGGYDVLDAKVVVMVKSVGVKKTITRKDERTVENVEVLVHDDTAEATLGLWGTAASSPFVVSATGSSGNTTNPDVVAAKHGWKPGETVLLLQSPAWKIGCKTYLSLSRTTLLDVNPAIADTAWLRHWSLRQKSREAINPPFPSPSPFDLQALTSGPVRALYTIANLDEFARAAPSETFQGYLSVVIVEVKLLEYWKRNVVMSGECCGIAAYANTMGVECRGCGKQVSLRINPRVLGLVVDESGGIAAGKLLLSERAWEELLGRKAEDLLRMEFERMKYLSDRLLFCRVTLLFGWTGDETKAGGRVCVMGVRE